RLLKRKREGGQLLEEVGHPYLAWHQVLRGLCAQIPDAPNENYFAMTETREAGVSLVSNLKQKRKFRVNRIAVFTLLAMLMIAGPKRVRAQEGMTGAEYGRRTQIEAKKAAKQQRKAFKKAAKKQRKALKKYAKAQRKAAKKANRRTG
ncbi:MAG: hypothetical protein WB543_15425, partial [Candidatus Acidiferrum sp.]